MSDFQPLVESNRRLTETVEKKISEIDNHVEVKLAEVDETMANLFLDPKFGIQPSHESINATQLVPALAGGESFVIPILVCDVIGSSSFNQASFVVDIFASGATSGSLNWFRQLHVAFKQQHTTFTYSVKCTSQSNGSTGAVFLTFDPSGGHDGAGQLVIWVDSQFGYNTVEFVGRGRIRRFNGNEESRENDLGALHFRKDQGVLKGSSAHDSIKAIPNYTELDV